MSSPSFRLLLIRGLGHSGTTILDLALGAHPQMIGLGEAVRVLQKPLRGESQRGPAQLRGALRHERLCTCGQVAAQCPVWGPVLDWLPAHDQEPLPMKLGYLMESLRRSRSAETWSSLWVVESFQDDFMLPFLEDPSVEVRVIHLTRDVRSWVHSRAREGREKGVWLPGLRPLLRWWRLSARHERLLRKSGKKVFQLGYEELALDPEQALRRVCVWLELEFRDEMLQPLVYSRSHILSGNRMRFDSRKGRAIRYDAAWMDAPSGVAQLALMLPWLSRLNQRLVYSALRQR
jgi:hypothetical protein